MRESQFRPLSGGFEHRSCSADRLIFGNCLTLRLDAKSVAHARVVIIEHDTSGIHDSDETAVRKSDLPAGLPLYSGFRWELGGSIAYRWHSDPLAKACSDLNRPISGECGPVSLCRACQ